jgi:hypothetical protein
MTPDEAEADVEAACVAVADSLWEVQTEDNGVVEVPDGFKVPSCRIAAVECQQMVVRPAIALSAIPKHASFYVQTAEIPLGMLEAAIVPPARA